MRAPPTPRKRRARRKETIDGLIEGWTTLGLDYFEREYLAANGYGRWINRGRVTAEMIVELLLLTLEEHEDTASDPVADRATERWRMIEVLHRRRVRGLTDAEEALLHDLERLDREASRRSPPALHARTAQGLRVYEPDDAETARHWARIRKRHPEVVADVLRQVTEGIYSTEKLKLGMSRTAPVIELGEQARLQAQAERLRHELGERFLRPLSTMEYRAARVRKWRQLARGRETTRTAQ